jgi:hypothetical protein
LQYCVEEEDIEMTIKDWQDDWRVPVLNQDMSTDKEVDAGKEKTPKKPKCNEEITAPVLDALREKTAQAQTQARELT